MKKILLGIGTLATVIAPIASVVACSSKNTEETYRGKLAKNEKIKILTLGDSVAHGDYTFQMSGSGDEFKPLIDGPARGASYQSFLYDEFIRDGLMDENDKPNYRTSISGLRSPELLDWIKDDDFEQGMKDAATARLAALHKANPTMTQAETDAAQAAEDLRWDLHKHPYVYGSKPESSYDYPAGKNPTKYVVDPAQIDDKSMSQHIKESNVVLITIGGNDILKDINILGVPFPNIGDDLSMTKVMQVATEFLTKMFTEINLAENPNLAALLGQIKTTLSTPTVTTGLTSMIGGIKAQLASLLVGGGLSQDTIVKAKTILDGVKTKLVTMLTPLIKGIDSVPNKEWLAFDKWFMGGGFETIINVDEDKFKASIQDFSNNIKGITTEIHKINKDANVIFTGYPSPLMHFPKIIRNLAMPFYSQIDAATEKLADSTDGVYFADSSLKNWETDDPTDIYDNIFLDPHPTLDGQGVMAQDIIKVIDKIYDLNSKITTKELNAEVSDIVESHKASRKAIPGAKTVAQDTIPYQSGPVALRGDIDYAYNVKPLPLEEITHAKWYFGSRFFSFLIDAFTDSIKLNPNVKNPGDQSIHTTGKTLTLSDFTKKWGDSYLEYVKENPTERFVEPMGDDFVKTAQGEFVKSLGTFINGFEVKIQDVIQSNDKINKAKSILELLK